MQDAWQTLTLAGDIFQKASDEVGWARTRCQGLAPAFGYTLAEFLTLQSEPQIPWANNATEQDIVRMTMRARTGRGTNSGQPCQGSWLHSLLPSPSLLVIVLRPFFPSFHQPHLLQKHSIMSIDFAYSDHYTEKKNLG